MGAGAKYDVIFENKLLKEPSIPINNRILSNIDIKKSKVLKQ